MQLTLRRPRVLLLLHLPPPLHGAAHVGEIIRRSVRVRESLDCTFVSIATGGYGVGFNARWVMGIAKTMLNVLRAIFVDTYDVIYITPTATGLSMYKDIVIALCAKARCRRVVYHFHNTGFAAYARVPQWLKRVFLRDVTLMLHSPRMAKDFTAYLSANRLVYVPLGIKSQMNEPLRRVCRPAGEVRLLYLSNMMREKGVFHLIDALAMLDPDTVPFHCTFAGQWFDVRQEEFDSYVEKKGLCGHVSYVGPRFDDEKSKSYSESDVFVFPSLRESFGLVVLEAMSAALPVIGTDVGAVRELLGDDEAGIVVPPGDSAAMAAAIDALGRSPEQRQRMGQEARMRYINAYTVERFEDSFARALLQVAFEGTA